MEEVAATPITHSNYQTALALSIHPEQEKWTPSVSDTLARAYVKADNMIFHPYGIINSEGKMIGFYAISHAPIETYTSCYIVGLLIDKNHQSKGYGKAAIKHFLRFVRKDHPSCEEIFLTVHPDNKIARRLYKKVGFIPTGQQHNGEDTYTIALSKAASKTQQVYLQNLSHLKLNQKSGS